MDALRVAFGSGQQEDVGPIIPKANRSVTASSRGIAMYNSVSRSGGVHGLAAELVLCLEHQRQTTASTTTSPPRPPRCDTHSSCPNNTRRPLPTSIAYSSSSSHAMQGRTGHVLGSAMSFSACLRRRHTPLPLHPHQGIEHDGKYMPVVLQARAHCFMAHLEHRTPSLTCSSRGGADVAGKPASRDATSEPRPYFLFHTTTRSTQ